MSPHRLAVLMALAALALPLAAAEVRLKDGTALPYDELVVVKETPQSAITLKSAGQTRVLKWSEVDLASLPEAERKALRAYLAEQLQKRIVLKDDKWVHRNELLLKADARYTYAKPLAKVGASILNFTNGADVIVTVGVRQGDRGYELHVDPGKTKGYQVPNGPFHYVIAVESEDGTQLAITRSKDMEAKDTRWTITITRGEGAADGTIEIPPEYQVHP